MPRIALLFCTTVAAYIFWAAPLTTNAFTVTTSTASAFVARSSSSSATSSALAMAAAENKGFGGEKSSSRQRRPKSEKQIQREKKANQYDDITKSGGQEYSIYVRQFGSDDQSWLPCGAVAVPRDGQVADAVYSNEAALKENIIRTYPKLRGFEEEFEFGFNLKVYPDDPIEVAFKGKQKSSGPSLGNWISNLLSPVDASKVPPSRPPTE